MKLYRLAIIIAIILFIVPFFWLAPGEMNLGGDSGRLYFYDPAAYLRLHVLYNYLESGHGTQLTYYIYLPYIVLLYILKLVLRSPTILISFFNGVTLSVGFFSIYRIVKELLREKKNSINPWISEFSSILAGLFYLLSQIAIYSGWEKPIITFNQISLNPWMALLLLRFLLTQKMRYLTSALLTTFVFTPNFSIVGAPPFFAFYPITIVFLFLYAKFARGVSFRWRLIAIGILLFFLIHAFHLTNTVESIFSPGSSYNQTIFAQEGSLGSRNGLSYFIAVAGTVKTSRIWMSLSQYQDKPYFAIFFIFPAILVIAFFLNRSKTLVLTGFFFLIFFYLASAITETGFFVYKQFFRVPGFSMFRNFHGQWSYAFYFFYALLLGQAIAIVMGRLNKRIAMVLIAVFSTIIIGFGLPLLTGTVPMPSNPDTGVRNSFRMDPAFERVLRYFTSAPADGKVLMLPLTDPGYQLLAGKDGGFYRGLPMISYLAGKAEFGGYETLRPFQGIFLDAMRNNDYETLRRLFSVMNIRWVFYNSDPYIMSDPFQSLYSHISKYAPIDQDGYKTFIEKLPITKVADFGPLYHIYAVRNDVFSPHIFPTKDVLFTNDAIGLMSDVAFGNTMRQAVISVQSALSKNDPTILYALPKSFIASMADNNHLHKHVPFLNRKLDDVLYPLVVLREKLDLMRRRKNPDQYLDYVLFLLSKRVEEMKNYGVHMTIGKESWQEPYLWEINKWFSYNSWNASLARYERGYDEIIDWIDKTKISDEERKFYRIKVNEQLYQHEIALLRTIRDLDKENGEKVYLVDSVNVMYQKLFDKIHAPFIDPSVYTYRLPSYANSQGTYTVYLYDGQTVDQKDLHKTAVKIGNQTVAPGSEDVQFDVASDVDVELTVPVDNLIKGGRWSNSGTSLDGVDDTTTLVLNNTLGEITDGLTLEIPRWTPETTYLISFDYNTNGDDVIFSFTDKKPLNDSVKKNIYKVYFEKRLKSDSFKSHQSVLFAETNSVGGFLNFFPFSPKGTSTVQVKNLIVKKFQYPQLVFKKNVAEKDKSQLPPLLKFTKINPTKYVLDIKGATSPYTLVFLEAFNGNWKLFDTKSDTNSIRAGIARFFAGVGRQIVRFFIKEKMQRNTMLAGYVNNGVGEGMSINTFLDSHTFDTWGKNTVLDRMHVLANGYGNAWYITPDDMGGKKDYTLVLELKTQKLFYPAILVSLFTVASLLLYSMITFLWPRNR